MIVDSAECDFESVNTLLQMYSVSIYDYCFNPIVNSLASCRVLLRDKWRKVHKLYRTYLKPPMQARYPNNDGLTQTNKHGRSRRHRLTSHEEG